MARRRRDRWLPDEAVSLPREARGDRVGEVVPPAPVRAWIRTYDGQDHRVDAAAIASSDAVLIEWEGQGRYRGLGVAGHCEAPHGDSSHPIAAAVVGVGGCAYRGPRLDLFPPTVPGSAARAAPQNQLELQSAPVLFPQQAGAASRSGFARRRAARAGS